MRSTGAALLLGLLAAHAFAQKAETYHYQAPLAGDTGTGVMDLTAHEVRDSSGQVISGSLDFSTVYHFPGTVTFTSIEVRRKVLTVLSVPLTIPTDYFGTRGFTQQVQVGPTSTVLTDLQQHPEDFSVELKNTSSALAGQFAPARQASAMTSLTGAVPGIALVTATAAFTSSGSMLSASLKFAAQFPGTVSLTRVSMTDAKGHTLLDAGSPPPAGRAFWQYTAAPDLSNRDAYNATLRIFDRPDASLQLATSQGVVSGALQTADTQSFPVTLLPSFESPPATYSANAPSLITVNTLRDAEGLLTAASMVFDVNYRLPSPDRFTGLYLQKGGIGINGLAAVSAGYTALAPYQADPSGSGNVTATALLNDALGLATIETLLHRPDQVYVNLHTNTFSGGALRSQLGVTNVQPHPAAVINSVNDPKITNVAPGTIISIYGTDLAASTIDLNGYHGSVLSPVYQGVSVTVGGRAAPFTYISPGQINAQVPFESAGGLLPLVVSVNSQESAALMVNVQPVAPGIFFDSVGGVVVKNADFSVVRPDHPAHPDEVLVIYCTGLGQTMPPLSTGWRVLYPPLFYTAPVDVTIGGEFAPVIYSIASPQYVGLYQVAVKVPADMPAGNQPVVMTIKGVRSNVVTIATAP
jgi:uncharacterized protein (TIGR03437 family)